MATQGTNPGRLSTTGVKYLNVDKGYKYVARVAIKGKLIAEYNSITEAYSKTGINHIGDACKGCRKSAGGFTWRYL